MRQFYFTKEKGAYPAMPKPRTSNGNKNMIGKNLMRLRQNRELSQRDVTDIEILAFCQVFHVTFEDLIKDAQV